MKPSFDLNPSRITITQRIKSIFLHSAYEALHNLFPDIDVSPPSGTQRRPMAQPALLHSLSFDWQTLLFPSGQLMDHFLAALCPSQNL